jgi:hypothetical protein
MLTPSRRRRIALAGALLCMFANLGAVSAAVGTTKSSTMVACDWGHG